MVALEVLSSVDGARYRARPPGTPDQILNLSAADAAFNVISPFTQITKPFSSTSHHLVIYNVGVPGADAYELANVITPAGTQIDITVDALPSEDRVSLTPAFQFAFDSPTYRVFLVDGAVSYLCDPIAGTLVRYDAYTIAQDHSTRDSHAELIGAGASSSLMADRISSCTFSYLPGTAERAGLLSLNIGIADQGESISLLAQVHVDNVP